MPVTPCPVCEHRIMSKVIYNEHMKIEHPDYRGKGSYIE